MSLSHFLNFLLRELLHLFVDIVQVLVQTEMLVLARLLQLKHAHVWVHTVVLVFEKLTIHAELQAEF